jgi:hypothetical protein
MQYASKKGSERAEKKIVNRGIHGNIEIDSAAVHENFKEGVL